MNYNSFMIEIYHETADYVLCVKPKGVISEENGMVSLLSEQLGCPVFPVHRLDKEAAGLMVYAKNKETAAFFSRQIQNNEFHKTYLAVIEENPSLKAEDTLEDFLYHDKARNKTYAVKKERKGVKKAVLNYQIVCTQEHLSLVHIDLITGRTHQIRVQFATRQSPLLGDRKYGNRENCDLALYSHRLSFVDPSDKKEKTFVSDPPSLYPWNLFF